MSFQSRRTDNNTKFIWCPRCMIHNYFVRIEDSPTTFRCEDCGTVKIPGQNIAHSHTGAIVPTAAAD